MRSSIPSPIEQLEDDRCELLRKECLTLAGSSLMLTVCFCYLVQVVIKLVNIFLLFFPSNAGKSSSSLYSSLAVAVLVIVAAAVFVKVLSFWLCYLNGKKQNVEKLSLGLTILMGIITFSLVSSILSISTDSSVSKEPLAFAEKALNILYFAAMLKTVMVLKDYVLHGSYGKKIPGYAIFLMVFNLIFSIVTTVIGFIGEKFDVTAALDCVSFLLAIVITFCLVTILRRLKKLAEKLQNDPC